MAAVKGPSTRLGLPVRAAAPVIPRSALGSDSQAKGAISPVRRLYKRWRQMAPGAIAAFLAFAVPKIAWARTARRYVSRHDEKKATLITVGVIAFLFIVAYFNGKREDKTEDERVRSEVKRLVRLKKEFEEKESNDNEDLTDDSMAAALRAASEKMAKDADGEEKSADESAKDEKPDEASDDKAEDAKDDKEKGDEKKKDDDKKKGDEDSSDADKDKKE